jgi:glycosyltransferase involved in cell wall biosynthesis
MRTLIISHGHPAFSIGGAEVASHNLFRALNAAPGQECYYLARATHPLRRHTDTPLMSLRQGEREVFLHTDAWDPFWLSNGKLADLSGAFSRYIEHVRPDVVHFHHFIGLGMEAIAQVRRLLPRTSIVLTFHEYLPICLHHGQMVKTGRNTLCTRSSPADCAGCFPQHAPGVIFQREQFLKNHFALADAYVSPSHFLVDRYADWGLPREKFHVIENGLDARPPAPHRPLGASGRRERFGFFGQVTEFKGLAVLLDAVTRIPEDVWGNASLCVFGGNLETQPEAFRTRFTALMERAGRRARFYGSYRPDDLPRLMEQIDWTVMPSIWWENSPVVIQESFLHRRPLIVSDIGGMAEKVRAGIDGMHFRAGSPEDLADRLTEALEEPALWQRLVDGAPTPPDLATVAAEHLAVYENLVRPDVSAPTGRRRARRSAA